MPNATTPETFPRAHRLRRRADFLAAQDGGRRISGVRYLLLVRQRADAPASAPARFGVTVTRKVGKAVVRNRIKRWLRESYRRCAVVTPPGVDLVVVARPQAAEGDYRHTHDELRGLLRRAGRR